MHAPAIEVSMLGKIYRDGFFGHRRVEALKCVSFCVERSAIFGLLGPNGAGKTTLIKILLGLVRKTSGSATLLGLPAGDRNGRRAVGYLPENHRIPRHHTGNTALEYYGSLSGMSGRDIRRRRPELLEQVGLGRWGRTSVKNYSKGMLQRLGLAQSMLHEPELLILDEPTDGVDPVGRSEMRAVLQRLKDQGKTVFINSHLLQEVELVCDRVAILVQGELKREGRISDLTERKDADWEMILAGPETTIREALQLYAFEFARISQEQIRVTLRLADQKAADHCVDELRRRGVSIVSFARRRDTLEEAFLDIVAQGNGSSPTSPIIL
jgi:ABC-2 type transport system ATP-binding protein